MRLALALALLTACPGSTGTPTEPVDGECASGRFYTPGCDDGSTPSFAAGCYDACEAAGDACDGGGTCTAVTEHPCVCAAGEMCCQACGAEALLCL